MDRTDQSDRLRSELVERGRVLTAVAAAASVLQVFHAPSDGTPGRLDHEIEFRDWVREMAVSDGTLFVAARGDGLHAFDLAADPALGDLGDILSGNDRVLPVSFHALI